MEKEIIIKYNFLTDQIQIQRNDFSTFEAFGVLEAAKSLISNHWLVDDEY